MEPALAAALPSSTIFAELTTAGRGPSARSSDGPSPEELAERAAAEEALVRAAHERGVAEGRAAVEAEFGDAAAGFAAALSEVARGQNELCDRHERALLGIAVSVAEKILLRELSEDPEQWLPLIREGISKTLDRERIRVRVGRSLHHFLAPRIGALHESLQGVRELELIEDASLGSADCVLETAYSDLELSIGSQIEVLADSLLGEA